VSGGLRVKPASPTHRAALQRFAEDVYLHQVVARAGSTLRRYADLPEALEYAASGADDEWRIHFHVPLFRETLGPFRNTQDFLRELLSLQSREALSGHLEVETYTWHVLPPEFRGRDVTDDIAREIQWTLAALPSCLLAHCSPSAVSPTCRRCGATSWPERSCPAAGSNPALWPLRAWRRRSSTSGECS